MSFRGDERRLQLQWKARTSSLTQDARRPGVYTGKARRPGPKTRRDAMFLHEDGAQENLLPFIRERALAHFELHGIDWHDGGRPNVPSNFLMDSMVSCVNCLFPFAFDATALARLFRPLVPDAVGAIPIEDGLFLTHEWIGAENYLEEASPGRKRGAKGTSIDAYCVLTCADGRRVGLLIEWKYLERNEPGRRHGEHYRRFLEAEGSPVDVSRCGGVEALFHEPYYQLARQVLLASRMEVAKEFGAERFLNVLLVPAGNLEYRDAGCSPQLQRLAPGRPVHVVLQSLLVDPSRFACSTFQELAGAIELPVESPLTDAVGEVLARYCAGRAY